MLSKQYNSRLELMIVERLNSFHMKQGFIFNQILNSTAIQWGKPLPI